MKNVVDNDRTRPRWVIPLALVFAGLALGAVVSWPLPKHFTTAVPYTISATPETRVVGMIEGDHLQYMYHLDQLRLAVEGHTPWFRNTSEFAGPYGFKEFYAYFPTALIFWPLSYVSYAFAFNTIIMLSFVGAMVAGYGLARAWGANRAGAFCAGIVLTLFPARLASLYGGQPAGSAFFLFPMALWGLERSWERGRAGWGWLAAACLVLLARLDPHYLFFLGFLLPLWAFWKLVEAGTFARRDAVPPSRTRHLLDALPPLVAALAAAGCVQFNQIRLHVIDGVGLQIIALAAFFLLVIFAIRWLIARAVDWLGVADESFRRLWLTVPWLALWLLAFYFLAGLTEKEGFGLHLVRACVGLFLVGHVIFLAVAAQRGLLHPGRIRIPWRRIVRMWPVVIGLAIAAGYGMYLKTAVFDVSGVKGGRSLYEVRLFSVPFGELFKMSAGNGAFVGVVPFLLIALLPVIVVVRGKGAGTPPDWRRRMWISVVLFYLGALLTCGPLLGAYVPLYETLYHLVPLFSFTRATIKYAVLTATFGSVAFGLLIAVRGTPHEKGIWRVLTVVGHIALVWIVAAPFVFIIAKVGISRLPNENEAYAYVAGHSQGAPLLELPIWPGDSAQSSIYQYWTLRTHVPTINGYSPTVPAGYIEHVSWPLYDLNYGRFGQREAKLVEQLGVRYINFHEEVFPRKVAEFPATTSLKMLRLSASLRLVAEDGPIHLFEILDHAAREVPADQVPVLTRYVSLDQLKAQVGTMVDDDEAQDGQALVSDGRAGQLFYGPFAVLPAGDYVAVFRIKAHAAKPGDEIGVLDIYAKRDKTPPPSGPLVALTLTGAEWMDAGGYRFVEIPFTLDGAQVIETRGWFDGMPGTSLALDYVFIQSKPRGDTIRLEAEEFFHASARLVEAEGASQGFCLEFDAFAEDNQQLCEERFVLLDKGTYRVTCATWQPPQEARAIDAVLAVRSIADEKPLRGPGALTVTVAERAVYAISVWSNGAGPRWLDYVEIAPAE